MTEPKMPKAISLVAACALAVVAVFIAAEFASAPSRSTVAATTTTTTPSMSPLELMIQNNEVMPVEIWDAS